MKKFITHIIIILLSITPLMAAISDCHADFDFTVSGATVVFTDDSETETGDITYAWVFGDGTTSSETNPTHIYDEPGVYTVCLYIETAGGCSDDKCEVIIVGEGIFCASGFEYIVSGMTANFSEGAESGPGEVSSYFWDFGDGTTSDAPNPDHVYAADGTYEVCLTITTTDGCTDTQCYPVTIGGAGGECEAAFEFTADGLTVTFTDVSMADVTSYHWTFGDGTESDSENPTHTYTEGGTYIVCLIITTADGCIADVCMTIEIDLGAGDCSANFDTEIDGTTVYFNSNTTPGPGDVEFYVWNFGDGGALGDGENPIHEYTEPGIYTVCLTVHFFDGCVAEYCHEISVGGGGGGGDCDASFILTSLELTADGWVAQFENTSVADADIISVLWYFGDGTTATTYDAEHVYLAPGEDYNVCVIITTADGCVSDWCDNIFIGGDGGDCESDFDREEDGLTVFFTEDADGAGAEIISYIWSFGDGTTAYGADATHTYDLPGEYEACLTIITADSCIDTYCKNIHVEGEPMACIAGFNIESLNEVPDGWAIHLLNTSDGTGPGSENYHWTFGDGGTSEAVNPEHVYTEAGIYTICVTIGEAGTTCYDTYCQEIFIGGDIECANPEIIDSLIECIEVYNPVCGCDGVTYQNSCFAENYGGILFWSEGACGATTIEEENIVGFIQLAPNPAKDMVELTYTLTTNADVRIVLLNMVGQELNALINKPMSAGKYKLEFNTSDLTSGIYLVHIIAGNEQSIQKLIISK